MATTTAVIFDTTCEDDKWLDPVPQTMEVER